MGVSKSLGRVIACLFLFIFFTTNVYSSSNDSSTSFQTERLSERIPLDILYSDRAFQTATRSIQHLRQVTDNVTVITREELEKWPVQDVDEALGLIPGIVVQDDGHIGQIATAQIYGSKEREVRVMVDGIPFNPATTGGIADLSQIPLDIVEKIEIIKGASSSVWGSSLGGVVNIITKPTGEKLISRISSGASFGEFGTQRERGEVAGKAGPLGYYAFGSYVDSGGFRPHSDVLEKRSLLKGELPVTDNVTLNGLFGYSGSTVSEFDLPRLGVSLDRQTLTRYGSIGASSMWGEKVNADVAYKISERSFRRTTRLFPSFGNFRLARARSLIHEVSLNSVIDIDEHQTLVLGSDIGLDIYQDSQLQFGTTRFTVNKDNTRHSYYGNYQWSWWAFDATLGSRLDATSGYGTNFDPSAGLVFHLPFWNARLRGNVARAFNAPSLTDRYLSVGATIANPDLKAEHAVVYNLGLEADPVSKVYAKAVFFQTFLRDSIQTIRRSDGLFQSVNVNKEKRTGFETEVKLGPWFGFSPSYAAVFVYAVDGNDVPLQGRPRLTHDVKMNFAQQFRDFLFNAHVAGRHTDLVTYGGATDPIDQTFMAEGKLMLTLPEIRRVRVSCFLEGGNLLNQDFGFDGGNDPAPQRHFEAGFEISFAQ